MKINSDVNMQMKPVQQNFSVVLIIMLNKVSLISNYVYETQSVMIQSC